jgi:hypothetical protein
LQARRVDAALESGLSVGGAQHRLDVASQVRVGAARGIQRRAALLHRQFDDPVEDLADPLPIRYVHRWRC